MAAHCFPREHLATEPDDEEVDCRRWRSGARKRKKRISWKARRPKEGEEPCEGYCGSPVDNERCEIP